MNKVLINEITGRFLVALRRVLEKELYIQITVSTYYQL